jgi:hypothetical protein
MAPRPSSTVQSASGLEGGRDRQPASAMAQASRATDLVVDEVRILLLMIQALLSRGDGLRDVIDGLDFGVAAGAVSIHHDGKGQRLAAGRSQITAQAIGFVERAGLGPQTALERGCLETIGQRAVHSGDGEGVAPGGAPAGGARRS